VNVTNVWSNGTNVNTSGATWAATITPPTGAGTACSATSGTFTAAAYGNPAATAADPTATGGDTWTVNQVKLISNSNVYLGP